jgi:hypothetical protein
MNQKLHICKDCIVEHYDNCPRCFGFGLRDGPKEETPVAAKYANNDIAKVEISWKPCPYCKSTPSGINE